MRPAQYYTHSAATRRTAQASWAGRAAAMGTAPARAAVGGQAARPAPFAASGYTHKGSRVPRTEPDAHSDALVTATSRKSCSYTSPERGETKETALPPFAGKPRLSLTYIAASFVGRKHTTHLAKISVKNVAPRAALAPKARSTSSHPHARAHTHAQPAQQTAGTSGGVGVCIYTPVA